MQVNIEKTMYLINPWPSQNQTTMMPENIEKTHVFKPWPSQNHTTMIPNKCIFLYFG